MANPRVQLRQATIDDTQALVNLLNQCYREDVGWTNEADLIGGIRTTPEEIAAVIQKEGHYLFVFPDGVEASQLHITNAEAEDGTGELLGCIAVEMLPEQSKAYIGTFAVHPDLQGQGIGHQMLEAVETFAHRHLSNHDSQGGFDKSNGAQKVSLTMSILENRPELLAYYERRGYQLTGESMPFPEDGNNGEPKVAGLKLLTLEKWV